MPHKLKKIFLKFILFDTSSAFLKTFDGTKKISAGTQSIYPAKFLNDLFSLHKTFSLSISKFPNNLIYKK